MAYRDKPGAEEAFSIDPETKEPYAKGKAPIELVSLRDANEYRIDKSIAKIYLEAPFLGYVFTSLKRTPDWNIATAGISPNNEMFYNPRFMASLTVENQKYVLFHECLHRLHSHFIRGDDIMKTRYGWTANDLIKRRRAGKFEEADDVVDQINNEYKAKALHTLMNIAEDIAINQYCDKKFSRLPIGVHLDEVNAEKGLTMEAEREWEYYLSELEKDMKENPEKYESGGQSGSGGLISHDVQNGNGEDDPSGGNDIDGQIGKDQAEAMADAERAINDELFKNIVRKAKDKQREFEANKGIGTGHSNSLLDVIPDCDIKLKDKNLWKSVINKRFGTQKVSTKEMTLKRPSRRNPANPFGKRRMKVSKHNVVIIDTSGSCLDDLPKFFAAIQRACKKYKTTVDLLFTTTQVYSIYKNQRTLNVENYEINSGGTDLTTAQKHIMDNYPKETSVICITDGYTDWLGKSDGYGYKTSMIYTKEHAKVEGITEYAVIDED
tara:strand:- start:950 stop:2431 length:1482 start_codon:yes stop_codon:yes gene_type:complete